MVHRSFEIFCLSVGEFFGCLGDIFLSFGLFFACFVLVLLQEIHAPTPVQQSITARA